MKKNSTWQGICPDCGNLMGNLTWPAAVTNCPNCSASFPENQGVYQLMTTDRLQSYTAFLEDYTRIRHAEGRGSHSAEYYMRLPEPSLSDPQAWQWRIRNDSYRRFVSEILSEFSMPLNIVDIGAGVGWLSYRLAEKNHNPAAIDLSIDRLDGLAAGFCYGGSWPRIQAEFDQLPLADDQADMVIYNSSLHYSTDYRVTLDEALRVLRRDGMIVIMDTPVYKKAASGEQMKAERHNQFEQRFGFRSDSINSIEFLTWDMLLELGSNLGIEWKIIRPWYGWQWALRPLKARLTGRREPSSFAIITGKRINRG